MRSTPPAGRRSRRTGWCAAAARRRRAVSGRLARARNVRGAFALRPGRSVAGKRVVIIDDVMTTGATVEECARVLRRAGAGSIGVLTLARGVRTGG